MGEAASFPSSTPRPRSRCTYDEAEPERGTSSSPTRRNSLTGVGGDDDTFLHDTQTCRLSTATTGPLWAAINSMVLGRPMLLPVLDANVLLVEACALAKSADGQDTFTALTLIGGSAPYIAAHVPCEIDKHLAKVGPRPRGAGGTGAARARTADTAFSTGGRPGGSRPPLSADAPHPASRSRDAAEAPGRPGRRTDDGAGGVPRPCVIVAQASSLPSSTGSPWSRA